MREMRNNRMEKKKTLSRTPASSPRFKLKADPRDRKDLFPSAPSVNLTLTASLFRKQVYGSRESDDI